MLLFYHLIGWHDKKIPETYLKPDQGECLHYYFYFIDQELGLCYVRVPAWCPFRDVFQAAQSLAKASGKRLGQVLSLA